MSMALPLVALAWISSSVAADADGGPRYTYFDAGYQWADVNYAVKQDGGKHEGIKLNGSLGLANFGDFGVHVFGEFFDGDFSGVSTTCGGSGSGSVTISGDRDSQSLAGGLGLSYAIADKTHLVARAAYVDISDFQVPDSSCQLVKADDHGYFAEGLVRSELSENVEIEAGVRYSDLSDSDISNTDIVLGIGYHVTDYLTLRARGIVFDDDTGIELGARLYFGNFLGRDSLF
ncbi:MAG: hypothetical protein R3F24_04915 [Gammaproteobacteria bacterium]